MKYYLIKCENIPNLLNTEYVKVSANGVPYGSFYGHECVELTEEELHALAYEWNDILNSGYKTTAKNKIKELLEND